VSTRHSRALPSILENAELAASVSVSSVRSLHDVRVDDSVLRSVTRTASRNAHDLAKWIARMQSVQLCFVVDTTGSMASYMKCVHTNIEAIVRGVRDEGCTISGLAFVGYKDWRCVCACMGVAGWACKRVTVRRWWCFEQRWRRTLPSARFHEGC
jgi:Mg-chelatase subunit ChlD